MASKRKVMLYIIGSIILVLLVLFTYRYRLQLKKITTPFFMAIIIAYLINPIVKKLENKKIPRAAGIILIYLLVILVAVSIILFLIPEIINNTRELMNTVPEITGRYQTMINNFIYTIHSSNWPPDVKNTLFREIQNGIATAQSFIMDILRRSLKEIVETITMVFDVFLAMIIAYYFIKDGDFFKNLALSLVPRRWRNGTINTGRDIHLVLSNFIQGQLLVALIVGTLETIGLFIIEVKYPLILGLVGGIANIIPYFGPIIGAVPAVAVALLDSPIKALLAVLVFTIIQQIDNSFISPKIIEGRLGLHPVTTILAVLVGGEFFGITGMLLSVPVTAILKAVFKRAVEAIT